MCNDKKIVLVIDGQGGRLGTQLIEGLRASKTDCEIIAVGTNSAATAAMLKSGADRAATGENSVKVAASSADIITGPVGIVIADSLLGEITPASAAAVGSSRAKKVLIPMNRCDSIIVGVGSRTIGELISDAVEEIKALL